MKKLAMFLLVCLLFVGCGKSEELDIAKATSAIEKTLTEMVTIEDSTLKDAYSLNLDNMQEYVFKQNEDGDFYAIIKTNKKTEVKNNMKEYFAKVKEFNTAYSPERLQLLEDRLEKELGDTLIYIIANNSENIYNDVLNTIE